MEFLIAGIIATLGLVAGAITSGIDVDRENKEAYEDFRRLQIDTENTKKDELAELELKTNESKKNNELNKEQRLESLKTEYEQQKSNLELNYDIEKKDAMRNADLSDLRNDFTENQLSQSFNDQMGMLQLNQLMSGLSWNNALVSMDQSKGSALASIAGNGTRAGGSISNAVELESATNIYQLQAQEAAQRQSDIYGINSALNGIKSNMFDVTAQRNDADYLRGQYAEGGGRYSQFQAQLNDYLGSYNLGVKQTNENYLRTLEGLNSTYELEKKNITNHYDRYLAQQRYNLDKFVSDENSGLRFTKGMFNLGTNLTNTGIGIYDTVSKYGAKGK